MSQMQSSFDARSRFVILWILAELWFPVLVSLGTGWLVASDNFTILQVMGWLSTPITALCQIPLLRGRVQKVWLWLAAAVAATILLQLLFTFVLTPISADLFERPGSGLAIWLPYFLLSAALAGIATGVPQAVTMGQWKLGAGGWFLVVLGASLIAGTISGVIWVMSGVPAAAGESELPVAAAFSAAVRQIAFGLITGVYMWQRLAQRSVDAAKRVP